MGGWEGSLLDSEESVEQKDAFFSPFLKASAETLVSFKLWNVRLELGEDVAQRWRNLDPWRHSKAQTIRLRVEKIEIRSKHLGIFHRSNAFHT